MNSLVEHRQMAENKCCKDEKKKKKNNSTRMSGNECLSVVVFRIDTDIMKNEKKKKKKKNY